MQTTHRSRNKLAKPVNVPRTAENPEPMSPVEELTQLKVIVTDLQTKRLSALRLYQDEKNRRQEVEARVEALSAQLSVLQNDHPSQLQQQHSLPDTQQQTQQEQHFDNSPQATDQAHATMSTTVHTNAQSRAPKNTPPPPPPLHAEPLVAGQDISASDADVTSHTVRVHPFVAEVYQLSRLPAGVFTSLTWYTSDLADVLPSPPDVLALLKPVDVMSPSTHNVQQNSDATIKQVDTVLALSSKSNATVSYHNDAAVDVDNGVNPVHGGRDSPCDVDANGATFAEERNSVVGIAEAESKNTDALQLEVANLRKRLNRVEIEAADAHRELAHSEDMLSQMQEQLLASTTACREMITTVNEQEDTITHLSQKQ